MKYRIIPVILSLILALSFLTACNKEGTESTENSENTTVAPTKDPDELIPYTFPEDADILAGSWTVNTESASMNFFFGGNGRGYFTSLGREMKMAYELDETQVIIAVFYEESEDINTTVFDYKVEGDKLTLTTEDGLTQVFTKDPLYY